MWKRCEKCEMSAELGLRAAVCLGCGKKFLFCYWCWRAFTGCSEKCRSKARGILSRFFVERELLRGPGEETTT